MSEQQIGHLVNWRDLRTESGEFWHPEFWSPALDIPQDEEGHLVWYVDRVAELNLETESIGLHEDFSLATNDLPDMPVQDGWFILAVFDTDDGPYVTAARIRKEETPA